MALEVACVEVGVEVVGGEVHDVVLLGLEGVRWTLVGRRVEKAAKGFECLSARSTAKQRVR